MSGGAPSGQGSAGQADASGSVLLGTTGSASSSSSSSSDSPFSLEDCEPHPKPCGRDRSPLRASKSVVRPGRRNGGTTLVFTLKQGTVVRFTIVRVYPSCKRIGSFSVRAHSGVNRVRFHGRVGERPLAEGTYRLVAQARGEEAFAVTVTIVVVRGKTSSAELRRARRASACTPAEAREIETAIGAAPAARNDDPAAGVKTRIVADPIVGAAKAVVKKAQGLTARVGAAVEENVFADPFVLVIVGLMTLAFALLGTLVLLQVVRIMGLRERGLR
jgi:hypothetical protein